MKYWQGAPREDVNPSLPIEDVITRYLRLYISVKLSPFTFYAVLTPLPYVNNRVAELIYGELRFPAISN
jgi:hypothetical protein